MVFYSLNSDSYDRVSAIGSKLIMIVFQPRESAAKCQKLLPAIRNEMRNKERAGASPNRHAAVRFLLLNFAGSFYSGGHKRHALSVLRIT